MASSDDGNFGKTLMWIGLGAFGVGAFMYMRRRGGLLGRMDVEKTRSGGMTLTRFSGNIPIKKRVAFLQDLVWKGVQDPEMRKLALQITRSCPARDSVCEAKAIYGAVKNRVRYSGDVAPVKMGRNGAVEPIDLFQSPRRSWEIGGGDCDDHSTLVATLLILNGIPARLRITAPSSDRSDDDWAHIYTVAELPKNNPTKTVALDTTLPGANKFGVEAPAGKHLDFVA